MGGPPAILTSTNNRSNYSFSHLNRTYFVIFYLFYLKLAYIRLILLRKNYTRFAR